MKNGSSPGPVTVKLPRARALRFGSVSGARVTGMGWAVQDDCGPSEFTKLSAHETVLILFIFDVMLVMYQELAEQTKHFKLL